jgi:hypothetical protein
MIEQHADLQDFCSTSMPLTTAETPLFIRTMPVPTPTGTVAMESQPAIATCAGQLIEPSEKHLWCDGLTDKYKVPTGDLIVLTRDWSCKVTEPICAPPQCPLRYVDWGEEWTW